MANPRSIKTLRDAIPQHCFKSSSLRSLAYICLDSTLVVTLAFAAYQLIPALTPWILRAIVWQLYGFVQGLFFTGVWILAHECGHGALFGNTTLGDSFGLLLHSFLLVPYHSWKITHARHHRYTNHMDKDTAFVPYRESESTMFKDFAELVGHAEDAPLYNLLALIGHQILGWQAYMLFYASGGTKSSPRQLQQNRLAQSHFSPSSVLFTPSEAPYVLLSTVGVLTTMASLYLLGCQIGHGTVLALYGLPYLWVNNWIVAITYLHHTHPDVHHYEASKFTFVDGALGTVDRPGGWIDETLFHGIISFHVVHHLFPRIPFYHAEEATAAIKQVLGPDYLRDETPFWTALWRTFTRCRAVEEVGGRPGVLAWK